ncbi:MAG: Gfo/Idh/MocA family protein [Bryobacteraceae bacterium]
MKDLPKTFGVSRRDLLGAAPVAAGLLAGEAQARAASVLGLRFSPLDEVRLGLIGLGQRGSHLLANFLALDHVRVTALCDIVREHALQAQQVVEKHGQPAPALYDAGDRDFENLCRRDDIDLVVIATPWRWHSEMAAFAMRQAKHVAVEVPAARTLKECWDLVSASERSRRHCVMLENCCYGYNEMLVLNMVRAGLFGELTHGAAAYLHDLRSVLFSTANEGLWRRAEHIGRNGNLYPTHGLGPVARYMGIHRGDRLESLVSMSSPSRSLQAYRRKHLNASDPRSKETYLCGDQNTSLIRTARGLMIRLEHNVVSPQPYDRVNMIAGTGGIFRDYPPRIFIDGETKEGEWETIDRFRSAHEDPLWTREGELARKLGGHGGMDFLMCYRLIQCMREGLAPDMDVYDAAAWSAPAPLSELSVARGGSRVEFPDFTRGGWRQGPGGS